MSSPRPAGSTSTLKYLVPRLKPTIIGNVPYLLIDDYLAASLNSRTHDYKDRVYYDATVNAALASEKAVINSLNSPALMRGLNFYSNALASYIKEMISRAFKTRYPDLPLPKLEKYEGKGAFEEIASLLFEKFIDEHGRHLDRDSIEKMAKLAAAELLLQVYIKFFEDVGALRVMA
ncbi:MAG: hypothetical protein RXO24_04400 [Acidilobus sp.]|jgi:hypothetical protein